MRSGRGRSGDRRPLIHSLVLLAGLGGLGSRPVRQPYLVADILPGAGSSQPRLLVDVAGVLYFVARDGAHGAEVWRSDGTEAGTAMVADLNPDRGAPCPRCPSPPQPTHLTAVGGRLFFDEDDGTHGREPWVTDGSRRGTRMVEDVNPGSSSSRGDYGEIMDFDGTALFEAREPVSGTALWRTDGTSPGTRLVKEVGASAVSSLSGLARLGDLAYFSADDGVHGEEPWRTDGTAEGTFLVGDIRPGADRGLPAGSYPREFTRLATTQRVYFTAEDGTGRNLWSSDGTARGTSMVAKLPGPSSLLSQAGGRLFLWVEDPRSGRELWASDGTGAGTLLVKDIRAGTASSSPDHLASAGDVVLFGADDGVHGIELWRSDGTAEGTFLVRDLSPGSGSSVPRWFVPAGQTVYFTAGGDKCSLWMTDGTEAGTQVVPGGEGVCATNLTVSGRHLFFELTQADIGSELWALELR